LILRVFIFLLTGAVTFNSIGATLLNMSARGYSENGEHQLTTGFVVSGSGAARILIKAECPSLAEAGIADPMPDPRLNIVRVSDGALIETNDSWITSPNAGEMAWREMAPGRGREPAVILSLESGVYTATIESVDGIPGTCLASATLLSITNAGDGIANNVANGQERELNANELERTEVTVWADFYSNYVSIHNNNPYFMITELIFTLVNPNGIPYVHKISRLTVAPFSNEIRTISQPLLTQNNINDWSLYTESARGRMQ
jgi:hypothetical protein